VILCFGGIWMSVRNCVKLQAYEEFETRIKHSSGGVLCICVT
jgi:hypothetical protein